jgi:membrane protease YdiL (CAAX protease family)
MTRDSGLIAPRWHTAVLVSVMLAVAILGALLAVRGAPTTALPDSRTRLVRVYLPMIAVQWGLLVYVCRVGRQKNVLRSLLGAVPSSVRRALTDVTIATVSGLVIFGVEVGCSRLFGVGRSASLGALLPRTAVERLTWVAVAASAGFCEEVVYRGYLQRQFAAFTGCPSVAVALSAALFGLAHGEQGLSVALRAFVHGLVFGVSAEWRRSLVPGILCHVAIDLAGGLSAS